MKKLSREERIREAIAKLEVENEGLRLQVSKFETFKRLLLEVIHCENCGEEKTRFTTIIETIDICVRWIHADRTSKTTERLSACLSHFDKRARDRMTDQIFGTKPQTAKK